MPHVFNHEKGAFEQVHTFNLGPLPMTHVSKRHRNREYVKHLLAIESAHEKKTEERARNKADA
eukprot:CAMPEP_0194511476 /NCGR_PEP_ID=MMETSP0253-20130528/43174_1 /TAXON_ID=2966 /ORGANISM="Noctiluca scintillans" /LENGTH=62 /DNA_ID=CAMNT_0039354811 /DNA_START=29 /DNA_END=217 /DNA_ORIENTATION=+